MKVWIANDHGGYEMKKVLVDHLTKNGIEVRDLGSASEEIVRYPFYASDVVNGVLDGRADRGVLICSTGIGMSIIANKYPGIRAALCGTTYAAKMTRRHNDSNVLCLGGKTMGIAEAQDIVDTWLTTDYEGGRHRISLKLIQMAETEIANGRIWNPTDRSDPIVD